jgi:seryl-tRNA synthetase
MKKMAEIVRFIQDLRLPAVDAFKREREKLYAEFAEKEKASKGMEEEMNICDKEYEQRKKEHRSLGQQCETIETDIKEKRDLLNSCLLKLPSMSSLGNPVGITDLDIVQAFSIAVETKITIPLQDRLTDNLSRKRKAGQMLECAWQVCEERQKGF